MVAGLLLDQDGRPITDGGVTIYSYRQEPDGSGVSDPIGDAQLSETGEFLDSVDVSDATPDAHGGLTIQILYSEPGQIGLLYGLRYKAALLAVSIFVCLRATSCDTRGSSGPAAGSTSAQGVSSQPLGPAIIGNPSTYYPQLSEGSIFTDGMVRFSVSGSRPATLRSVRTIGASDGLETLGYRIAGAGRTYGVIQLSEGFPPQNQDFGRLRPVEGYVVKPGDLGAEILVGMRTTKPGAQWRAGVEVVYEVGGDNYTAFYPSSVIVCPAPMRAEVCKAAKENGS